MREVQSVISGQGVSRGVVFVEPLHDENDGRMLRAGTTAAYGARDLAVGRLAFGIAPHVVGFERIVDDDGAGKSWPDVAGTKARHLAAGGRGIDPASRPAAHVDVPAALGTRIRSDPARPEALELVQLDDFFHRSRIEGGQLRRS